MGSKIAPRTQMVLFDPRIGPANIVAQGGAFPGSSFTESGPVPGPAVNGDPTSRFRPQIAGEQSVALALRTIHGGFAGIDGARVIYQLATDNDLQDYRGWNEPNLPTRWSAPNSGWVGPQTFSAVAAAVLPDGVIVAIGPDAVDEDDGLTWGFNPRTEQWDDRYDWSTGPGLPLPVAMVYDPITDRLIAWSGAGDAGEPTTRGHWSSDGGLTWTLYTRGQYPVDVVSGSRLRVAVDPRGGDWLGTLLGNQIASSDGGVTFDLVEDMAVGLFHTPIRTRNGWVIAYIKAAGDDFVYVRRLGSARSLFSAAEEELALGLESADLEGCADIDGTLYLVATGLTGDEAGRITVVRSSDGGLTWVPYAQRMDIGIASGAVIGAISSLVASMGQLHMVYWNGATASGDVQDKVAALALGGWSQVEAGSGDYVSVLSNRMTYGFVGGGGIGDQLGLLWLPIRTPENSGWTDVVSTASVVDFTTAGAGLEGLRIFTTAGEAQIFERIEAIEVGFTSGEAIVKVNAGTADLATIGATATASFLQPILNPDGSAQLFAPFIDIASDGLQLRDSDGTTIIVTDTIPNMTSHTLHIRWQLSDGQITVWYRQRTVDSPEIWHLLAEGETVSDVGGPSVESAGLRWGHADDNDADVVWKMAGWQGGSDWLHGVDPADKTGLTSADGVRGMRWGKAIPSTALGGYPIPEATSTAEGLGFLSASGGRTFVSEGVSLPVEYLHGIQKIHPLVAESPRDYFEPLTDATLSVVYNLGLESWLGGAVAFFAALCRCRTINLQFDNGAGAWDTPGATLDFAAVTSALYTLVGDIVVPRTGTPTNARYHPQNDFVDESEGGGWIEMSTDDGGGPGSGPMVYRRIVEQSPGYWTDSTTVQQMRLRVEGLDGTEDIDGTGTIFNHSGLFTFYTDSLKIRQYLKITIAAMGVSGKVVRIGTLGIGGVAGIGSEPDWGWSWRLDLEQDVSRSGEGALQIRRRGPPRRVVSYTYVEGGALLEDMRLLSESPDYIAGAGAGTQPIGTEDDAWSIWDLIEHKLVSGERPLVFVPKGIASNGALKDRTRFLYGKLVSTSFVVTGDAGIEGQTEHVRVEGPTIEEIR